MKKNSNSVLAALLVSGLLVLGMAGIGVNALANPSTASASTAAASAPASSDSTGASLNTGRRTNLRTQARGIRSGQGSDDNGQAPATP